jgi:hypothetical protein
MTAKNLTDKQMMGWQFYFGDKLKGRETELSSFRNLVIKVRSENPVAVKVALITNDAQCFSSAIIVSAEWKEITIPLKSLQTDSLLLLPRPFPGFLPLWFKSAVNGSLDLIDTEKLQVLCHGEGKPADIEITSVWLEK